jgi:hypothetical protein
VRNVHVEIPQALLLEVLDDLLVIAGFSTQDLPRRIVTLEENEQTLLGSLTEPGCLIDDMLGGSEAVGILDSLGGPLCDGGPAPIEAGGAEPFRQPRFPRY